MRPTLALALAAAFLSTATAADTLELRGTNGPGKGKPIVALRTATHAFDLKSSPTYRRYTWNSREWDGGFGRQVLGETWIAHHGRHAVQSTRGITAPGQEQNPILRGIRSGDIWVPT